MPSIATTLLLLISFLIGSIPTGYILGRLCGVDLRSAGSGNIGATNAARVLGKKFGAITLVGDILKGVAAASLPLIISAPWLEPLCGAAAVIGHCYSPALRFNGGKGVATALGVFLAIAPVAAGIGLVVFLGLYKLSGFVSVGSIGAALALPLAVYCEPFFNASAAAGSYKTTAAFIIAAIVIIRHKQNIFRLLSGEELRASAAPKLETAAKN